MSDKVTITLTREELNQIINQFIQVEESSYGSEADDRLLNKLEDFLKGVYYN